MGEGEGLVPAAGGCVRRGHVTRRPAAIVGYKSGVRMAARSFPTAEPPPAPHASGHGRYVVF